MLPIFCSWHFHRYWIVLLLLPHIVWPAYLHVRLVPRSKEQHWWMWMWILNFYSTISWSISIALSTLVFREKYSFHCMHTRYLCSCKCVIGERGKVKGVHSCSLKLISELRSVTCHVGDTLLPATGHRWMHPALTQPGRLVLDLSTPEGWEAELTGPFGYI